MVTRIEIYSTTTEIIEGEVIQTIKYPPEEKDRRPDYLDIITKTAENHRKIIEEGSEPYNKVGLEIKITAEIKGESQND